jgi:hypothetical protein
MPNRPTADRFHAPPERSPDFAHLSIDGLREYRLTLTGEENRVSYWRRIIQARLDLIRAADNGTPTTIENLGSMFTSGKVGGTRAALLGIVPVEDMPPLPELGALWAREPRPDDHDFNEKLIDDLARAETELSVYRKALHRRLARATTELIARYREHPDLCLSALPIQASKSATRLAQ